MTEVKLQERISKQGKNEYTTYVITLPKTIIESIPNFSKTKSFHIKVTNGEIILSPKK